MTSAAEPSDTASSAASFTTDSNEFDDAQSHLTPSVATPTGGSRPDTPTQVTHYESDLTPRPTRQNEQSAQQTSSGSPTAPAPAAAPQEKTPERAPPAALLTPAEPDRKLDSEQTTLTGVTRDATTSSAKSGRDSEHASSSDDVDEKPVTVAPIEEHAAADERTRTNADKVAPNTAAAIVETETEKKSLEPSERDGEQEEKTEAKDEEDTSNYVSGPALWLLTFGLFLATFVVALDNTIIATAIPKITTDFDSLGDVGWYGSSYLLTTTSLQPSFGKIYSYFSIKWTYVAAIAIFEIGSIVCATAQSSTAFIVGRAVAGVGASALFSGGMTIIGYSVPLRRRAFYIAVLSSTFGIASVVGPLLGGVFTDSAKLTWRFCFWINLPFGGLAILSTILFFKPPNRDASALTFTEKIKKMDLPGAAVLIAGVVSLLLALQWGGSTYPWSDSKVWGCLLGFGLLIALFIGLQLWRGDDATVPPRIISRRGVAVGCMFSALLSMALYAHIFYLPFYFQAVKGTSAEGSGIRTIPYLVSITLASIVVGGSVTTFGPYVPFLWFGSAVFTVGSGMLHTLAVDSGPDKWIGYQILAGIGAGSAIQIPFISAQVVCPGKDLPVAMALTVFFNSLGGALSISIAQNIFSNELLTRLESNVPAMVVYLVESAGATDVHSATPAQYLAAVLQDYNDAITKAFVLSIAVGGLTFLVSLLMPWGSVKGKKLEMGAA